MDGTTGGASGTNGVAGGPGRRAFAAVAVAVAVVVTVNAMTATDDARRAGLHLATWEPWVWEVSSAAFWLVAMPLLWRLARVARPPRIAWPAAAALCLAVTIPASALHLAWLGLVRPPIYAAFGAHYAFDWSRAQLIYEFRKDVPVALMFIGVGYALDLWTARGAAPAIASPAPPFRFEVRDGSRVCWLAPAEIERVEAAGNYVELHTAAGALLHRATLASVEAVLAAHGFVRIHRSRLVRAAAVIALAATPSGDFAATLASGAVVAGSRRFRGGLG